MLNNTNFEMLETTQTLILPIYNYAVMLEREFGNLFNASPVGIYKVGELYPSIVPNKRYFAQRIGKDQSVTITPITDFNQVTDTVVDEQGNIVIHSSIMRNKEQYLRNEPTIPVKGITIIDLLVRQHIENICQWSKSNVYNNRILSHIKPECIEAFNDGFLDRICEALFKQVDEFIGRDEWHIYFVKFIGLDLLIEKTIDYRVHEYHKRVDSGDWPV